MKKYLIIIIMVVSILTNIVVVFGILIPLNNKQDSIINNLAYLKKHTEILEESINDLENESNDFFVEDWRNNVNDVINAVFEVKSDFEEIQTDLAYIERDTNINISRYQYLKERRSLRRSRRTR